MVSYFCQQNCIPNIGTTRAQFCRHERAITAAGWLLFDTMIVSTKLR